MKRDYNLWRLILLQKRDGIKSPELEKYDAETLTYNAALLVQGGYVEGEAIENGSGICVSVVMTQMTNAGHDLLERLESESHAAKPEPPMTPPNQKRLAVFISHSAKDEKLASTLVELLRSALNIPADEIRCTSVNGYRLPIGTDTEERLRDEVQNAKAFIGLITPSSIESAYVMFELGARWGAKLHLAPLLGAGAGVECLQGPLSSLNALNCKDRSQVHQLISDLADFLEIHESERSKPAVYQNLIDELARLSASEGPNQNDSFASTQASGKNPWLEGLSEVLEPIEKLPSESNATPIQALKDNHALEVEGLNEEIKKLRAQIDEFGIKAQAVFNPPSSLSVEAVNVGRSKIIIKSIEATFANGETETKPPYLTKLNGNLAFTSFELNQKGDIQYLEGINTIFSQIPKELVLIDTLGTRYPVLDLKKAITEFNEWPLSAKQIAEGLRKTISPEFVGGDSKEILHKCSQCKRGFKVQNPNLIANTGGGTPTVTCPHCGQVDQLGYWAPPD